MKTRYNIVHYNESGDSVTLNHEPMTRSNAYEAMEILRRAYQASGFGHLHELLGFELKLGDYFCGRIELVKVQVDI